MPDRLRLLIVDCLPGHVHPVGGLERRLLNWATHLGPQHDVTLGSLTGPDDTPGPYRIPGEPFTRHLFANLDDLHDYTHTVDALSIHQWHDWVTNPAKTLYMIHSSLPECFPTEYAAGTASPEWSNVVTGLQSPTVVATCSDWASRTVTEHTGRPAITLYSGIHPAFFSTQSPRSAEPVIGFHGRLAHSKGVPMLLDFAESGALGPYRLELTALSPDPDVLERAQRLEHDGYPVRLLAPFEHPEQQAAHVASCALTVMPSVMEGFGTAAIESQAAGVRVVAHACGGLAEAVHEQGGALVDPTDPDEFLTQIHAHAGRPVPEVLRANLRSVFSMDASADRYGDVLRGIAARSLVT